MKKALIVLVIALVAIVFFKNILTENKHPKFTPLATVVGIDTLPGFNNIPFGGHPGYFRIKIDFDNDGMPDATSDLDRSRLRPREENMVTWYQFQRDLPKAYQEKILVKVAPTSNEKVVAIRDVAQTICDMDGNVVSYYFKQ